MDTSKRKDTTTEIIVNTSDFVLTPLSCATLISELIKTVLYQKSQIPYPYTWLRTIVNRKRQNIEENKKSTNLALTRHFQTVSSAYDAVEKIIKSLHQQLDQFNSHMKEIIFIFGVTPVCPKEILTIKLSSLAHNHYDKNHALGNSKKQHKVLGQIFLSEAWMDSINHSLSCTNVYVFLKKTKQDQSNDDIFIPSKPPCLPSKVKHTIVNFNYIDNAQIHSCCDNLQVFNDSVDKSVSTESNVNNGSDQFEELWSQSSILIKGFKDCFINKVPASDLW